MVTSLLCILVCHVQTDMVNAVNLHLLVDSSCHNVAWSQRQALVIFLHEGLAIGQFQYTTIATHRLRDEVGGVSLVRIMQYGRVELYKLHISHRSFGSVHHGNTIARGNHGVGSGQINGSTSSRTDNRHLSQIGVYFLLRVQHVSTIALNVWRTTRNPNTQMVLCDNLHSEMVFLDINIRIIAHSLHQSTLNLCTRIVSMVQNAELRVPAFTMQVEVAILLAVEVDTPLHQLLDLLRSHANHLLYSLTIGDIVARNHRVLNVLFEVVYSQIGDRSDTSLCKRRIGLVQRSLTNHTNLAFFGSCHFQCIAHSSHASTDDEKIVLVNHPFFSLISLQRYKFICIFANDYEEICFFPPFMLFVNSYFCPGKSASEARFSVK